MAREVITLKDLQRYNNSAETSKLPPATSVPAGKDKYFDRLFKYIPAELVAGYIFVLGVMKQLTDPQELIIIHWGIFIAFCILTPLYLWRVQRVMKLQQLVISLLSFVVWVFALGGPFVFFPWYNQVYGEILLPVFTLIAAIWEAE